MSMELSKMSQERLGKIEGQRAAEAGIDGLKAPVGVPATKKPFKNRPVIWKIDPPG